MQENRENFLSQRPVLRRVIIAALTFITIGILSSSDASMQLVVLRYDKISPIRLADLENSGYRPVTGGLTDVGNLTPPPCRGNKIKSTPVKTNLSETQRNVRKS